MIFITCFNWINKDLHLPANNANIWFHHQMLFILGIRNKESFLCTSYITSYYTYYITSSKYVNIYVYIHLNKLVIIVYCEFCYTRG